MDELSNNLASAKLGTNARTVHLPLSKIDKCHKCGTTDVNLLKFCSSCKERVYCSAECQTSDWDFHKKTCGNKKNDPIELGNFYPILAIFAEACHSHGSKPVHPALDYEILNNVNPSSRPVELPDGLGAAKLLVLGEEKKGFGNMDIAFSKGWFLQAESLKVQGKLLRRLVREGYALPIALALCISLMTEIYTTDYDAIGGGRRRRLRYKTSPIADFGIANGEADVKIQDKLAYWFPDGTIMPGQDPKDHYWIYFTTAKGENITLDMSMFTFNMCICVQTAPYVSSLPTLDRTAGGINPVLPAFFRDRIFEQQTPRLYKERRRVSVLRNTSLHGAIANLAGGGAEAGFSASDAKAIVNFLNDFATPTSGPPSPKEQELTLIWILMTSQHLGECLTSGKWKNFPEEVPIAIEQDPGELRNLDERATEWHRSVKKWRRKYKKAKRASEKQD